MWNKWESSEGHRGCRKDLSGERMTTMETMNIKRMVITETERHQRFLPYNTP